MNRHNNRIRPDQATSDQGRPDETKQDEISPDQISAIATPGKYKYPDFMNV